MMDTPRQRTEASEKTAPLPTSSSVIPSGPNTSYRPHSGLYTSTLPSISQGPKTPASVVSSSSSSADSFSRDTPSTTRKGILRRSETPTSSSRVGWGYRETNTGDLSKISSLADSTRDRSVSMSIASQDTRLSQDDNLVSLLNSDNHPKLGPASEDHFEGSSIASSSSTPPSPRPAEAQRDPWQTPRPSTLQPRLQMRDFSDSVSLAPDMSCEQRNQSSLFDASLPTMDFTAAFPSPRRKIKTLAQVDSQTTAPSPATPPMPEIRAGQQGIHESERILALGSQTPLSRVSEIGIPTNLRSSTSASDASFSINESLWRNEGERLLQRFKEVEEEAQRKQRQTPQHSPYEHPSTTSPPQAQTEDESLPSSASSKTPKAVSRVRQSLLSASPRNNVSLSLCQSPRSLEQGSIGAAQYEPRASGESTEDCFKTTHTDATADEDEASPLIAVEMAVEASGSSLDSDKEGEDSYNTPGAVDRSVSFAHASSSFERNEGQLSKYSLLRRRPITPSSSQGPSPSNVSFSTAIESEPSPASAKAERISSASAMLPCPRLGPRSPFVKGADKIQPAIAAGLPSYTAHKIKSCNDIPVTPLDKPISAKSLSDLLEADTAETDASVRLSNVRCALQEFTTAQTARLGTLATRAEQDQTEAGQLRSLLSSELQSRVTLLEEIAYARQELERLRNEAEFVKTEREQERQWIGQRDEELRILVRKLEQQLERRFSAGIFTVKSLRPSVGAGPDELGAELESARRARSIERKDFQIRLAATLATTCPAFPGTADPSNAIVCKEDSAALQRTINEAVQRARESIERDHEVRVYRMERDHQEALEALQVQLDSAQKDHARRDSISNRSLQVELPLEPESERTRVSLQDLTELHDAQTGPRSQEMIRELTRTVKEGEEAVRLAAQRLQIINDLEAELVQSQGECTKTHRELEASAHEGMRVNREVVQPLETELQELQQIIETLHNEGEEIERLSRDEIEGLQDRLRQQEAVARQETAMIGELRASEKHLTEERETLMQSLAAVEQDSSTKGKKITELNEQLDIARDALDSEVANTTSALSELQSHVSSLQAALELSNTTKMSIENRLVDAEARIRALHARSEFLAKEASESDLRRLKLQKAHDALYVEFEKMGIALETRQVELTMVKRKIRKAEGVEVKGIVASADPLGARLAKPLQPDRDVEDSGVTETLLERGPNPIRARGRKTIDPWMQQQAALAAKENDTAGGGTPIANPAGTRNPGLGNMDARRASSYLSNQTVCTADPTRRRQSRVPEIPVSSARERSVLAPSAVGNISYTRGGTRSRIGQTAASLAEVKVPHSTTKPTVSASILRREESTSSLSSEVTTASSTSSRSKHSIRDSRSLVPLSAVGERPDDSTSVTSRRQSEDHSMSLEELRADASRGIHSRTSTLSSLRGRSLALAKLGSSSSISTGPYAASQSQSQRQPQSGHTREVDAETMDEIGSEADKKGYQFDSQDEDEGSREEEEEEVVVVEEEGDTTPTTDVRVRAGDDKGEGLWSWTATATATMLSREEARLEARELRVPQNSLPTGSSSTAVARERRATRESGR